jgi:chromosome segregation ATPase
MEASLSEIQSLMPENGLDDGESNDVAQLRALLREKNDKIDMLTSEFDAHRSDFRSTIDTLELASTETERVYEKKVEELQDELREYQARTEDVETVAMQLKQLEELVQELEEGLEDARRGEAEARGEVEFLRGEVERGRSELRREREKAAAVLKSAGDAPPTTARRRNPRPQGHYPLSEFWRRRRPRSIAPITARLFRQRRGAPERPGQR